MAIVGGAGGGCAVGLLVDTCLMSWGDDTLDGCLVDVGGAGANSGGGANSGKSFLFSEALNIFPDCELEYFNVNWLSSSESSITGGRGWMDMEGWASLEDCDRRLNPAYR